MSTSLREHGPVRESTFSRHLTWVGGLVFLGAYLASILLNAAFEDRTLPALDAPITRVATYFATEQDAVAVSAACNFVSAMGLIAVLIGLWRLLPGDRLRTAAATLAVASLLVSVGLSTMVAIVGNGASAGTVALLHDAGIYVGGLASAVLLGLLVASLVWGPAAGRFGRPTRYFGRIAAVIAILGIGWLVLGDAVVLLLLLGKVLCMLWTIAAGLSLLRHTDRQAVHAAG